MKKRYILILSLLIILLSMSCVSAGLFDGLFGGEDENKNITLIKETTGGLCTYYDDGTVHAVYDIEGVLKDLPNDIDGYDLKFSIYDENGKLIKEDYALSMKFIAEHSKESDPVELGAISLDEFKNVSIAELELYDADGNVIFDKNVTFTMENVDIEHYTKDTSSSDEDDDSDSYIVEKNEKQKKNEEYFNSAEYKRLEEDYWNSI